MSLRGLLALLLLASLVLLFGFMAFDAHLFFGLSVNEFSGIQHLAWFNTPFHAFVALLFALAGILFLLIYLLLDRIFIRPVKAITVAMATFASTRKLTTLPRFSRVTKEIRELTKIFIEFTDNVEEVHMRDMEMSRVKSDFISTAAHQFRTPLTGIRWALEALQKEPLSESEQLLVKNAVDKSRDLVSIVGTLLDISSIESGKHKYTFTLVDLGELVSTVTADFSVQAANSQVTLRLIPSETVLPKVKADHQQVTWILNNLIENAIRYTPAGGSVNISFAYAPGRVQILVRDTGIGITTKDRNNIFERFYRAENAVAKENKGNGLGLYIARTIAKDHGGDLNFAPNPEGPGTTFSLSLPTPN